MQKALQYEKYTMELNKRLFHLKFCDDIEEAAIFSFLASLSEEKLDGLFSKETEVYKDG